MKLKHLWLLALAPLAHAQPVYNQFSPPWFQCSGQFAANTNQSGASYTLGATNGTNEACVTTTSATAQTLTIPLNATTAFPVGWVIKITQGAAGLATITPNAGVTFNIGADQGISTANNTITTGGKFGQVLIRKIATDTWELDNVTAYAAQLQVTGPSVSSATPTVPFMTPQNNFGSGGGNIPNWQIWANGATIAPSNSCKFNSCMNDTGVGDLEYESTFTQPTMGLLMDNNTSNNSGDFFVAQNPSNAVIGQTGVFIGTDTSTRCGWFGTGGGTAALPDVTSHICGGIGVASGSVHQVALVGQVHQVNTASTVINAFDFEGNVSWMAIGFTTPVKWANVTSTGTNQASTTLGDTNSGSPTVLQGGGNNLTIDSTGEYTNGATGSGKGTGTINAQGLFVNGTAVSVSTLAETTGSTTPNLAGCTTVPTPAVHWTQIGHHVIVRIAAVACTSNSTGLGLASGAVPSPSVAATNIPVAVMEDAGALVGNGSTWVRVTTAGAIDFCKATSCSAGGSGWTNSATSKGIGDGSTNGIEFSYMTN